MVPKPQETVKAVPKYSRLHAISDDDEIVISGISGKFPNCANIEEFEYKLFNKVDMVQEDTTNQYAANGLPGRVGKIINRDKFDSQFFRIHYKQARCMDPQCRFILESAYESVVDAGVNPNELYGTKTGVFIAASFSEAEKAWFYELILPGGFGITGCNRGMMANRVSYCLGLTGPSFLIDSGSSGSSQTLISAYNYLRNGEIDAAIIGGVNIILFPYIDLQYKNLGHISKDGYCRPFDQNSSGYNRSEAVGCIFLQRKRDARRIYAEVVHAKANNDGYKPEGLAYFAGEKKQELLEEFYKEINFDPRELGYLEANANGVPQEDIKECEIIDKALCKYRNEPLLIGSIKSNVGQTDAASGIMSIIKACLAIKNGAIPPNLYYTEPRKEIKAICDGKLKVVSDLEPLKASYIGINSFALTGSNTHILLKSINKKKINNGIPEDNIPRLLTLSGRTEEGVEKMLKQLEGKPFDVELMRLLQQMNATTISTYLTRGYGLLCKDEKGNSQILGRDIQHYDGIKRPVVWVFSGMGSQWTKMGSALMEIPIIKQSLERCHKALEPKGLNLLNIITSNEPETFNNILHSFVGIAAIQIALVDLLKSLNLEPDYIIGHSVGELGCGYADGGFTPEQMILCSYSRGKVSLETEKIFGSMAAVGLGYNQIVKLLPSTIEVACRNSFESCTISGPADDITKFVNELKVKKIFAKEVPCSNIAYHSRYIAQMGPYLLKYLKEIIPNPKPRSEKWLSSSVPKSNWNEPSAKYCSAEYHTNNLLNSVLFEDTAKMLPEDALCIEIAPHSLLQAILKRSMPNAVHVGLTQRGNENNHHFLLQALGKIYIQGIDMPIHDIFPKVDFPVSNGTRSVAALINWDHTDDWFVTEVSEKKLTHEQKIRIIMKSREFEFLRGFKIDNRTAISPMFLIQIVIDFYAILHKSKLMDMNIQLSNLKILKYLFVNDNDEVDLLVMIQPGTGFFSITQEGITVLEGFISTLLGTDEITNVHETVQQSSTPILQTEDFYKELELRGQEYNGIFRGIIESHGDSSKGKIQWNSFYFAFLESLIQISSLCIDSRNPMLIKRIRQLRFFGSKHVEELSKNDIFNFEYSKIYKRIVAGGVEIVGLELRQMDRKESLVLPHLSATKFISNFPSPLLSTTDAVRCCIQMAAENCTKIDGKMKVVEYVNELYNQEPLVKYFAEEFKNFIKTEGQCFLITDHDIDLMDVQVEEASLNNHINCSFVILNNALDNVSLADEAAKSLIDGAFLISRETLKGNIRTKKLPIGFNCVAILNTADEILILLKKVMKPASDEKVVAIKVSETDTKWINQVKNLKEKCHIVLYTEKEKYTGILGMIKNLKDFGNGNRFSFVFIDDKNAPAFNLQNDFYRRQLDLGLAVNIFKDGQWGSYKTLHLKENMQKVDKFYAEIDQPGDLTTLKWYQKNSFIGNDNIQVAYASVNSIDVHIATGRIPKDIYGKNRSEQNGLLGIEFSGIDLTKKQRIMGIKSKNALSSHIDEINPNCMWHVPDYWSLEEAATVPYSYAIIYYAYFHTIEISKGHSILIHDGATDLGIAAIRIALAYGLIVFTTVRNDEQKEFLLEYFSELKAKNVGSCADESFEEMIQFETIRGVDYVLNTLSGRKMLTSLRCTAQQGHIFQMGKYDISEDNAFGMGDFLKEITLHTISLERFLMESDEKLKRISKLIQKDIDNGIITPIPFKIFSSCHLKEAFSFASGLQQIGKILINMNEIPVEKIIPQTFFDPELSYIVCDELNLFGVEFIDWMVLRGARKILLHSMSKNGFQDNRISVWKTYGATISQSFDDITTKKGCLSLLDTTKKTLGPIGGIFNLNSFETKIQLNWQHPEEYIKQLMKKLNKIRFLDELATDLCPKLNYFVILTSSCNNSIVELPNSMLNSIYEELIEARCLKNLPGKLLTFGFVEHEYRIKIDGYHPQEIRSCLGILDKLMLSDDIMISSEVIKNVSNINKNPYKQNLYDEILKLSGISDDIVNSNETFNLTDIGINPLVAVQIQKLLDKKLNLNFSFDELNKMELKKIKKLTISERKSVVSKSKLKLTRNNRVKGLPTLLPTVGDVTIKKERLVHIPNSSIEKSNPIIIIPGLEGGVSNHWYYTVTNWNSYPLALQLDNIHNAKSVKELAQSVFMDIKHALNKTKKYFFVAQSFGSLLALELAKLFEEINYKGKILLIDTSPHFLKQLLINNHQEQLSDEEICSQLFAIIIHQIDNQPFDKLLIEFNKLKSNEEKLSKFKEYIKLQHKYAEEYLMKHFRSLYNGIQMIRSYKESPKSLSCPIMLIKPTETSILDIEDDYNLSNLTSDNVEVKYLDGNHLTILESEELTQLVNDFDPNRDEQKNFEDYLDSGRAFEWYN